jgi:acyl carrier protein
LFDTTEGAIVAATAQEIITGLAEIVSERAGIPTEDVELDKSFADDIGEDELGMVEVAMAIEERFDVTIATEDIYFKTVGDAANYILKHQS